MSVSGISRKIYFFIQVPSPYDRAVYDFVFSIGFENDCSHPIGFD